MKRDRSVVTGQWSPLGGSVLSQLAQSTHPYSPHKYAASASSASRVRRWHRARTLEARPSRSRLALNLHLPAAQTVPATHVGGAPPCAARTCLLRSHRTRSARSSYCTLFNNRCVLSACSCISQNTHQWRASVVRFSAFRLPNPTQTRRREVHGGLWPRLKNILYTQKIGYVLYGHVNNFVDLFVMLANIEIW